LHKKYRMIPRLATNQIRNWLSEKKALVLLGPRQAGKTTLVQGIVDALAKKTLFLTGDDPFTRAQMEALNLASLKQMLIGFEVLVFDEAQRIKDIGVLLKMVVDHFPDLMVFVTGSSSLELAAQTKESMMGRKIEFFLHPIATSELISHHGWAEESALLEQRMLYGFYPEVITRGTTAGVRILNELTDGLMYKDLLSLQAVSKPALVVKLVQALALQVGNEVKHTELANLLGFDPATIEKYIDLLEKAFVVFSLPSLARNARNEIKKGKKIYFYDLGIRNTLIRNFSPMHLRNDVGALWENYLIAERRKINSYQDRFVNTYFWRTIDQKEIDYIEEENGQLRAFEFKYSAQKAKLPTAFAAAYPTAKFEVVHREDYFNFVQGIEVNL
jgi:uncharacterized protein